MLRFFRFDEPYILKVLLEGELNEASLPQYGKAIDSAYAERGDRKLLVDVKDLTLADAAAEQALLKGKLSGLQFVAAEGKIAELLSRQEHRKCREHSSFTKGIKCFFGELRECLVRPISVKLFRSAYPEG